MRKILGFFGAMIVLAGAIVGGQYLMTGGLQSVSTPPKKGLSPVSATAPAKAPPKQAAPSQVAQGSVEGRPVEGVKVLATDRFLGKADAPVTIIEYASLSCPACRHFHMTVLSKIKEEYIDTGKVRMVYRDFPLDRLAFAASLVARCNEGERYFGFVDVLFRSQPTWRGAANPLNELRNLARLGGIQPAKFDACMADKVQQNDIAKTRFDAGKRLQITGTPSLIINNKVYGGLSFEQIKAIIDPMLPKS